MKFLPCLLIAAGGIAIAACQPGTGVSSGPVTPRPVVPAGPASFDLAAFERFIDSRPTPASFRATYPQIQLVLPGDIATMEYRYDHSRFFADLDAQGRIVGGGFR